MKMKYLILCIVGLLLMSGVSYANAREQEDDVVTETVSEDLGSSREGSRTDAEAAAREAEAIGGEGLSVAQLRELRDKAEKHTFQAEVNRMMKLIINSLYKNKEIFLRELISNASDALDKLRLLSLTHRDALDAQPDMSIRIKAEPDRKLLHIIDTGIGMTRQELVNNLGTIAKSGTADFLAKMQDAAESNAQQMNDMIGQFGVGFYSAFLVADTVSVASKHDGDAQHVWQSDAASFSVAPDPRGDTLKRGTHITLQLKDEALDFLQQDTIRNLVKKYSQFINFPIYLWASKTVTEEVPIEESTPAPADGDDDDAKVEDAAEAETKTKKVEKTVWEWEIMNDSKPIWTRKPADVTDDEYSQFYRSLTKDTQDPLARVHFVAEGEVTFKALLFVPRVQPSDSFNRYGTRTDNIKLFVRRVFITDEFNDMIPSYLAFIRGLVDSDDLPLNVSRETLQQHKLIKIIKKKLVRKVLDMLRKLPKDDYAHFWKEYSTNIKLGVIEDPSNRSRLAKLLRFASSATVTGQDEGAQEVPTTFLEEYVSRMKPRQEHIYYIAAPSLAEARRSPFAERLVRAGREVLYLTEAVDEYCINSLPEFEGKKFQNIAKEIFNLDESDEQREEFEQLKTRYEVLTQWLGAQLEAHVTRAQLSRRLADSPCALVATVFGWTGNMERLAMSNAHQKANDPQRQHHLHQKKMLEINPRHPLIKELLRRVQDDAEDPVAKDIAQLMLHTATLRSGYMLHETSQFANSVENLMRQSLGIPLDAKPDPEEFPEPPASQDDETEAEEADQEREPDEHDEL